MAWPAGRRLHPLRHIHDLEASPSCYRVEMQLQRCTIQRIERADAVPLVMFEAPCIFRQAAAAALDPARIAWRVVFTSPSLSGLWAAVAAGLGISLRTAASVPPALRALGAESGLPPLPDVSLMLIEAPGVAPSDALTWFRKILLETCRAALGTLPVPSQRPARARARR